LGVSHWHLQQSIETFQRSFTVRPQKKYAWFDTSPKLRVLG
jgi:hypothetical protein